MAKAKETDRWRVRVHIGNSFWTWTVADFQAANVKAKAIAVEGFQMRATKAGVFRWATPSSIKRIDIAPPGVRMAGR